MKNIEIIGNKSCRFKRVMRISTLIYLAFTCLVVNSFASVTYSQVTHISLDLRNSTLKEVFKEIEKNSEFVIFFYEGTLDSNKKVSIRVKDETVDKILDKILHSTGATYTIDDRQIFIVKEEDDNEKPITDLPTPTQARPNRITGTIVDHLGEPIIGANVLVKDDTSRGSISDVDGNFSIEAEPGMTLVISYIGCITQEITIGNQMTLSIVLQEDLQSLEEIVIVGFAKQKKANLTGSVSSIKVDEILGDRPVSTTGNLLQGTIPGLQTKVTSGEPGAGFSFNIRGENSINGGAPLIVVDNIPYEGAMELLNPEDIQSITILKDGGAAAIYGARAAFGVILITTKGADLNQKFQLNYNNNFTFTSPWELPQKASIRDVINTKKTIGISSALRDFDTWLGFLDDYASNPSKYPGNIAVDEYGVTYLLKENRILEEFFSSGFQHKHDISASGGSSQLSYRTSFGYTYEDGPMATNKDLFERYNFRTFLHAKLTDWLTGQVDFSYIKSDKKMPDNTDYGGAVNWGSDVYMTDMELDGEWLPAATPANKAKYGGTNTNSISQSRITGKLIANPLKGLFLNAEYTFDDLRRTQNNVSYRMRMVNTLQEFETFNQYSSITRQFYRTSLNVLNIYGSYGKNFGKHNFNLLVGFNQDTYNYERTNNTGKEFISDALPAFSLAQEWDPISDEYKQYNTRGYFGRFNYDYDSRYLFEFNARYDGSSKFPEGNRWGFFPSVSVGWNIMRESFMESLIDYIPEFKVRGSYSTIGNQNVNPYQFNPGMGGEKAVWLVDGNRPTTLKAPALVSDNFTWETVETYNLGFDISLLRNRLQAGIDFYQRNTKDMLAVAIELPSVIGADAPQQNVADLRSNGFEFELKWNDRIGKVNYYLGVTLYNYSSKITKYDNETGLFYAQNSAQTDKRYREGMKIGEIWGYEFDRYYTVDDFVAGTLDADLKNGTLKDGIAYVEGVRPNPGDMLFKDQNGDGVINNGALTTDNPGDLKIIGNSSSKWEYGINGGASWNNFSFSFILQGIGKRDVWISSRLNRPFQYQSGTVYAHHLDYWTPGNTNTQYPRLYAGGDTDGNYNANFRISDRYLDNGAYLHVKNLTLGYTIPRTLIQKVGFSNIRVYGSVENPFIFNHLPKGLDPTLDSKGGGLGYPLMRAYSFGFSCTL